MTWCKWHLFVWNNSVTSTLVTMIECYQTRLSALNLKSKNAFKKLGSQEDSSSWAQI